MKDYIITRLARYFLRLFYNRVIIKEDRAIKLVGYSLEILDGYIKCPKIYL